MIKGRYRYFTLVTLGILINLYVFLFPCFAQQERGSSPEYIFFRANTFYEEGKYDDAINEYSKMLAQGIESGNLYYNLGNSYFKKGDLGKAVLHYERAKRLIPRDSDLKSNYAFARAQIKYNISGSSQQWFERIFSALDILTINEITILLSVVFIFVVLFLIRALFFSVSRRVYRLIILTSTVFFIFLAIALFNRISLLEREAVVITKSSEVRFEPVESATTHFTLYGGAKVYLLQSKKNWSKIRRPDGKVGWIKSQETKKI